MDAVDLIIECPSRSDDARVRGPPVGRRPEPRDHRRAGATRPSGPAPHRRRLPHRGRPAGDEPSRLARPPDHPADRRGGQAAAVDPRGDGPRDIVDPRHGTAGVTRGGGRRLRADGRDPAAHRRAAGGPQCRGTSGRLGDPRRAGAGDDRRCRAGEDGASIDGGPGDGPGRGGHRAVLRARRARGDHGPAASSRSRRRSRNSSTTWSSPRWPTATTTTAISSCATSCTGRSRPRSGGGSTHGPASSGRRWRVPPRSTRRSTTSGRAFAARRSMPPWRAPARPR